MLNANIGPTLRPADGTYELQTDSTGPSDYIAIPTDTPAVSVQLLVLSTASATVQATVSTLQEVQDGVAHWKDWDEGAITGGAIGQDATKGPITALRLNVLAALPGPNAILSVKLLRYLQ
jgi:hypothetical protein